MTDGNINSLQNEIARFQPVECIIPTTLAVNSDIMQILQKNNVFITKFDDRHYGKILSSNALMTHFKVSSMLGFGIEDSSPVINAAGALMRYLREKTDELFASYQQNLYCKERRHNADGQFNNKKSRAFAEYPRQQLKGNFNQRA